jgi:hypothetical protein
MHAASSLHDLRTLPRIQNSFALSPIFMLRDLHNIGALVPTTTAMLYSPHMDKDTKDILETVNFIKDHMVTKDDVADVRNEMHDGFAAINRRLDHIIQMQLDEHATRIKKLEAAVFSK